MVGNKAFLIRGTRRIVNFYKDFPALQQKRHHEN